MTNIDSLSASQADVAVDRHAAELRAGVARDLSISPRSASATATSLSHGSRGPGRWRSLLLLEPLLLLLLGLGDRPTTTSSTRIPSETYQYSIARPISSMTPNTPQHPLGFFSTTTRIGCCCPTVASAPTRSRIDDDAAVRDRCTQRSGRRTPYDPGRSIARSPDSSPSRIGDRRPSRALRVARAFPVRFPSSDFTGPRSGTRPSDDSSTVGLSRTEPRSATSAISRTATPSTRCCSSVTANVRQTRTGADFMRLALADRTGVVTGIVWDDVENASATARPEIRSESSARSRSTRATALSSPCSALDVPLEVDWDRLLDGPATPVGELERQLAALLGSLRDPHLVAPDGRAARREARTPGARSDGRSPPSTTITPTAPVCSSTPFRWRELTAAAAESFRASTATSRSAARCCTTSASSTPTRVTSTPSTLNDAGKLIGEIPSGYFTVRRCIEDIPDFPPDLAQAVAAHHPLPPRLPRAR